MIENKMSQICTFIKDYNVYNMSISNILDICPPYLITRSLQEVCNPSTAFNNEELTKIISRVPPEHFGDLFFSNHALASMMKQSRLCIGHVVTALKRMECCIQQREAYIFASLRIDRNRVPRLSRLSAIKSRIWLKNDDYVASLCTSYTELVVKELCSHMTTNQISAVICNEATPIRLKSLYKVFLRVNTSLLTVTDMRYLIMTGDLKHVKLDERQIWKFIRESEDYVLIKFIKMVDYLTLSHIEYILIYSKFKDNADYIYHYLMSRYPSDKIKFILMPAYTYNEARLKHMFSAFVEFAPDQDLPYIAAIFGPLVPNMDILIEKCSENIAHDILVLAKSTPTLREKLPLHFDALTHGTTNGYEYAVCCICYDALFTEDLAIPTKCIHIIHWKCHNNWSRVSNSCPYCNISMT